MLPLGIKFGINKKNCDHAVDDGKRGKAASFHARSRSWAPEFV